MRKPYSFLWNDISPLAVFAAVREQPYSLFFDSADSAHPESRYSFVAFSPFEIIEAQDHHVFAKDPATGAIKEECGEDPFLSLQKRLKAFAATPDTDDQGAERPPFRGGAAGLWGYGLGRHLEDIPLKARNSAIPDMAVGLYDQVFAYDHDKESGHLFIWEEEREQAESRAKQIKSRISEENKSPTPRTAALPYPLNWDREHDASSYQQAVQRVIAYIYEGDIFQANLSQSFRATLPQSFDMFAHYHHLRELNPAPFAACMNFGAFQIASASPERFIKTDGTHVETKPIKGTRPRFDDKERDQVALTELKQSIKDRAENTMIVDLLRNDLSRVCRDDSIEVTKLCDVESFAGVHHLVSTIAGRLRQENNALDLLRACFPGGSITGAPKIRAMEIIDELETAHRGPYCGTLGYVGFDGAMDSNIAIRTLIYEDNQVRFNAGGGIVAGSDPEAEYQETLDKAAKLLESFESETTKQTQDGTA